MVPLASPLLRRCLCPITREGQTRFGLLSYGLVMLVESIPHPWHSTAAEPCPQSPRTMPGPKGTGSLESRSGLRSDTIDPHATKVIARLHEFDAARAAGSAKPDSQKTMLSPARWAKALSSR